jgi:hypothetical protein
MRKTFKLLLFTALMLMATPLFACPECAFSGNCEWVPPPNNRCRVTVHGCKTLADFCTGPAAAAALAAQWTVASVEVTQPARPAVRTDKNTDKTKAKVAQLQPVRSAQTR